LGAGPGFGAVPRADPPVAADPVVGDLDRGATWCRSGAARLTAASLQRGSDRGPLLRRHLLLADTVAHTLGVDPGIAAAGDRAERDPVTTVVEQGEGEGHPPGHVVEGIESHQ